MPKEFFFEDDIDIVENAGFRLEIRYEQLNRKTLQVDYHLVTKKRTIAPDEYKLFSMQSNAIAKKLPIKFVFTK